MTSSSSHTRERLGDLLMRRRLDMDPRFRNRQVFASERGVEYRIVADIERGRRSNFQPVTIAALEHAYDLPSGAIGRFLDSDGAVPLLRGEREERGGVLPPAGPEWRPSPAPGARFTVAEVDAALPRYTELRARYDELRRAGIADPGARDMFPLWDADTAEAGFAAAWETAASMADAADEAGITRQTIWAVALFMTRREARLHGQGSEDTALTPVTAATGLPYPPGISLLFG